MWHCSEGSVHTAEKRNSSVFRATEAAVTGTKETAKGLSDQIRAVPGHAARSVRQLVRTDRTLGLSMRGLCSF